GGERDPPIQEDVVAALELLPELLFEEPSRLLGEAFQPLSCLLLHALLLLNPDLLTLAEQLLDALAEGADGRFELLRGLDAPGEEVADVDGDEAVALDELHHLLHRGAERSSRLRKTRVFLYFTGNHSRRWGHPALLPLLKGGLLRTPLQLPLHG